jgi:Rrf2 family protein
MDVLRRNTDYALRAMVNLAGHYGQEPVSTREIAQAEDISYQLACKLLQKLQKAGLVKSSMGPKGGFVLSRKPKNINMLEVIETIQGHLSLNRCMFSKEVCKLQNNCKVTVKLSKLQNYISDYLEDITLDELMHSRGKKQKS